jgi:hypothetical protein
MNDFKSKFGMGMSLGNRALPNSSLGPEQKSALWQFRPGGLLEERRRKSKLVSNSAEKFPGWLFAPPLNMGNHRLIYPNRVRKRSLC